MLILFPGHIMACSVNETAVLLVICLPRLTT
uniref:Uncharacterized protein n=1 Tax=Anguilla anguilla TaxID=7936 RepID=A0A0E9XY91_ANGAN